MFQKNFTFCKNSAPRNIDKNRTACSHTVLFFIDIPRWPRREAPLVTDNEDRVAIRVGGLGCCACLHTKQQSGSRYPVP
ncbi:MAG: hypothetical protein IJI24_07800 [Lachnospiraceae bacterium]|nr:hypothetical protein [Lachnospiraceae bacterium]